MLDQMGFFLALAILILTTASLNTPLKDVIVKDQLQKQQPLQNYRPIIGILSQEMSGAMKRTPLLSASNFSSYIAASYIKFIEAAGARVVPIRINEEDSYYEHMAKNLNGFLFPGGSAKITTESGYGRAGKKIYDLVVEAGRNGSPIPLWGTCLGFEMLNLLVANGTYPLTKCKAGNLADSLQLQPDFSKSKLFSEIPKNLLTALQEKNITSNFHKYCVTPKTFSDLGLNKSLLLLSTTMDQEGVEYVSTIEHRTLPLYGTQWHPEKAAFEWSNANKHNAIPHSIEAIRASQYLAETFVEEARKNSNKFNTEEEEEKYLIYNFQPLYVQKIYKSSFQQCYYL